MDKISAVLIVKNEAAEIKECLETINWVDEIVVVDDFSQDGTADICRQFTDKVFQRKFDDFSSQRNYALEKTSSEWMLSVDADERITPELKDEIKNTIAAGNYAAYNIPTKTYFLEKWLKYGGWFPDYHIRLFKKSLCRWQDPAHERVLCNGQIGYLTHAIIHHAHRSILAQVEKSNLYSSLEAEQRFLDEEKPSLIRILFSPVIKFIKTYIWHKGFLEGRRGLIHGMLIGFYVFLQEVKLWEKSLNPGEEKDPPD